jgi:hypothetical protein
MWKFDSRTVLLCLLTGIIIMAVIELTISYAR